MPLRGEGFGLLSVDRVDPDLLKRFGCGKPHLNTFLTESVSWHQDRLGLTTVVFHEDVPHQVVGYFTLANDGLPLRDSEIEELGLRDRYPVTSQLPGGQDRSAGHLQGSSTQWRWPPGHGPRAR